MKVTMLRLPDSIGAEIQKIADKKGIPFATAVKEMICERIHEIAPAPQPASKETSASQTKTVKEVCPA